MEHPEYPDEIIAGALFDFVGYLTTGPDILLGARHDSAVMVDVMRRFFNLRHIDTSGLPRIADWSDLLRNAQSKETS